MFVSYRNIENKARGSKPSQDSDYWELRLAQKSWGLLRQPEKYESGAIGSIDSYFFIATYCATLLTHIVYGYIINIAY